MHRLDATARPLALCLALSCGPGKTPGTDSAPGGADETSVDAVTAGATDMSATTAVPTEGSTTDGSSALCIGQPEVLARFRFDLDDWPLNDSGALVIDAPCDLEAIVPSSEIPVWLTLHCTDPVGALHAVELIVAKFPVYGLPMHEGQALTLQLRASADSPLDRGMWTLRDVEGGLLLAGYRADAPGPDDPDFFTPFTISLDADLCPAAAIDGCPDAQPLVLEFRIGEQALAVGHKQHGTSGSFDVIVERALHVNGDPTPCSDEYNGPEALQFMIVARSR